MSVHTEMLMRRIPHLRRHAYLLTGSRDAGDEYVRLGLERLAAEPERWQGHDDPLVPMFRALYLTGPTPESDRTSPKLTEDYEQRIRRCLIQLPLMERWAMVLGETADMSLVQIASILGLEAESAQSVLAEARRHLKVLVASSVLIIEDEPLIAMELNNVTSDMGFTSVRVVAKFEDAVTAAVRERPGLVLADLQLTDSDSGIEAAHAILGANEVPIVFVTGYPERLLAGRTPDPVFLVTKPFKQEQLKQTIDQALAVYAARKTASVHRQQMLDRFEKLAAAA